MKQADPLPSPKLAVYSAHPKPTMHLSEVKPAPGSRERSRLQLLKDQGKAATGGWTTSSIHPPSSMQFELERYQAVEGNLRQQVGVLESEVAMLKGGPPHAAYNPQQPPFFQPPQQQQIPPMQQQFPPQQPFPGQPYPQQPPPGQPYAQPPGVPPYQPQQQPQQQPLPYPPPDSYFQTQRPPVTTPFVGPNTMYPNLSTDPVRTRNNNSAGKSHKPIAAVETHQTNLLQSLQQQAQQAQGEALKAQVMLRDKENRELQLQQEMHQLRLTAAQERDAAQRSKLDANSIETKHYAVATTNQDLQTKLDNLANRYQLVEQELQFVKRELEESRRTPKYEAPSQRMANDFYSVSAQEQASTSLAAHVESLKAELHEAREQLAHRDTHIANMSQTAIAMTNEAEHLTARLRHEEQKLQMALSTTESNKVLLADATSEVEYLRLMTGEQQQTIDRLTRELDDRYQRVKMEMESRQVREMQCTNAVENVRHIHAESVKVHQALVAEQSVNTTLRDEISSLRLQLEDARRQNSHLRESHDDLAKQLQHIEVHFGSQAEQLEQCLGDWHKNMARQASQERGQLEACATLIQKLRTTSSVTQQQHHHEAESNTSGATGSKEGASSRGPSPINQPPITFQNAAVITHAPPPIVYPGHQPSSAGASLLSSTGAANSSTSSPKVGEPPASGVRNLEAEVRQLLQGELNFRRDAEASRMEAEKALAAHRSAMAAAQ